jgi:23S rRNA (uracil1939-C5)-methyltransferase
MLYGGSGVAENGAAFPFVLPGELVEITSLNELRILEPSPDRTAPGCIHFGVCGGCHYQHAAYPAQLRIKQAILHDTLAAAGLSGLPAVEVYSAEPWHYRNRIRLRVGEVDGELRVGYNRYNATGGDPLLPVSMCPIASPLLWQAAATLLELAKADSAVRTWLAAAIELELFTNGDETALQLTLFTRKPPATSFPAVCDIIKKAIPQFAGAGVALLPKQPSPQGRRFEHIRLGPEWGVPGLMYTVDGDKHWVSRGAFFQVNRHLVSTLSKLATANRTGVLAWDLYAGVGLFSRALADSFQQVVAVEAAEPAAASLAAALKGKAHRAIPATTLEFLQAAVVQRERPGLIVMDPPRTGVGPEVCALLGRIRAPEIVYVSCDPVTLARDLRQLIDSGYKLSALHLVDMFPQTFHMETVAVLHR